jgi:hypothetical protein
MMDALELLTELGRVDRVDQEVLDEAVRELARAIEQGHHTAPMNRRAIGRRSGRTAAVTVAAAVLTAAAAFGAVTWFGHPVRPARSTATRPASQGRSGTPTVAMVLAAVSASGNDVLKVTKIVRGEGPCCRTIIWIAPTETPPGNVVRSRIQTFYLNGSRLSDFAITYTAPATASAGASAGCDGIFRRPRALWGSAAAVPGTVPGTSTDVFYPHRQWIKGNVRIQAAVLPSAAGLRACLKDGLWGDWEQSVLAGAKAIELVSPDGSTRLWVSALSYLPIRLTEVTPTPYGPTSIAFGFTFLPPTAANQAMLAPPRIPAGFSRLTIPG